MEQFYDFGFLNAKAVSALLFIVVVELGLKLSLAAFGSMKASGTITARTFGKA